MVNGTPTKHSKLLNTYGTFTVPRSLDGFARSNHIEVATNAVPVENGYIKA